MPGTMLVTNIRAMGRSAETRARLQAAALELCARDGYDRVTVDQIAAAAGVTSMTFFRYFATKDAVILEDPYDPAIVDGIVEQPAGLPALERVCRGIASAWSRLPQPDRGDTRQRIRIVVASPALMACMWENNLTTQRAIVTALVSTGVERLQAEVAAGACLGAVMAALLEWGRHAEGSLGDCLAVALGQLAAAPAADHTGARR